jgi:hypothetical protein
MTGRHLDNRPSPSRFGASLTEARAPDGGLLWPHEWPRQYLEQAAALHARAVGHLDAASEPFTGETGRVRRDTDIMFAEVLFVGARSACAVAHLMIAVDPSTALMVPTDERVEES